MKIFIWGAGGQGRVVLDILKENKNFEIYGFLDSNKKLKGEIVDGVKVLGGKDVVRGLRERGIQAGIVAVGDNTARCQIADFLKKNGFYLINAIHPRASLASNVILGSNVTVAAGAIICTHAVIKDNVIINTGVIVEHENVIKDGALIASGVQLGGRVEIGKKSFIGIGATIIQCLKIGSNSIIGAGAVVLDNIPEGSLAVGIPAKVIRKAKKNDLLLRI